MNVKPTVCATCRMEYDANRNRAECPHQRRIFSEGVELVSNGWDGRDGLSTYTGGSSLGRTTAQLSVGRIE